MKKFFGNDSFLKVFSFVVAIIIWFYIIIVLDPPVDITIRDIPIQYAQQSTIMTQGLSVVDESKSTVELKIKGSRKKIVNLNSDNIVATIDLSSVTKAGEYSLPINLSIPYEYSEIVSMKPHNIDVVIDKQVEEKRNIRVKTVGNPESGYIAGTPEVNPKTVLLKGPASVIGKIFDVRVSVDISDKKTDVKDVANLELVDSSGRVISEKDGLFELVTYDISEAEVFCPVMKLKTVPIKLNQDSDSTDGRISVQPNMITVYGYEEDIEKIESILTAKISMQNLISTGEQTVNIELPEKIYLRDNVTTVTVKYSAE